MEYTVNAKLAVKLLKEEIGDEIDNLDEKVKNVLVEQKRQLLHNEWNKQQDEIYNQRIKQARQLGRSLRSERRVDRVGNKRDFINPVKRGVKLVFERSTEFLNDEEEPIILLDGRLHCFRKETVLQWKTSILGKYQEAVEYKDVTRSVLSYMYFKIGRDMQVFSSTRACHVNYDNFEESVDILFNRFYDTVSNIEKKGYGYSEIFDSNERTYVQFYYYVYYYPRSRDITRWGHNLDQNIKYDGFYMFTANDVTRDCIEQCLEFCKCTIEEFERACVLKPKEHILSVHEIRGLHDLELDESSYITDLSYIDDRHIYLLKYNGHVGVLHSFSKSRIYSKKKLTMFKPLLNITRENHVTVCFDIECYFDPEKIGTHIPYLCCACFVYNDIPQNIIEFEGQDCVAQMIEYVSEICNSSGVKVVELVAHNGGAYDFHYIISSLINPSKVRNILIRNNNFIGFSFQHNKTKFEVKDSYSFLLCSLRNAAKAFLNEDLGKTDFPHNDVRNRESLEKVYRKWVSVDEEINTEFQNNKLIISSRSVIRDDLTSNVYKRLIEWAREYCANDVIVLAKVWIEFKRAVKEIFNVNVVDQACTLAGMSFKLFEAHLANGVELHHPDQEDYKNIRSSLVGGRCISLNGIYHDVLCLDVKSLYPAAMSFYNQPYGKYYKVKEVNNKKLGVYYVSVKLCFTNKSAKQHGFFPIRGQNGNVEYNVSYDEESTIIQGWYTSVDINIGEEEGHEFEYIKFDGKHVGYEWEYQGAIFKEYINNVLYKYKLKYEVEKNQVKRTVIKIIMNSLWGKFAQRWIDTEYKIEHIERVNLETDEAYKIWEMDYFIVKNKKDGCVGKPVQNGVFTLSWARWHMKKIWDACVINGGECLYSDTDSIFVSSRDINLDAEFMLDGCMVPVIGDDIGQLEIECCFSELMCAGKKQYMGFYVDEKNKQFKEKKRFKGVPQRFIIPDLYRHLLYDQSYSAQIQFLKFKREWGSVKGYIESKNVKAT